VSKKEAASAKPTSASTTPSQKYTPSPPPKYWQRNPNLQHNHVSINSHGPHCTALYFSSIAVCWPFGAGHIRM